MQGLHLDPIGVLQQEHVALQKMFALHQQALVIRAWAHAAHLLEDYQQRLQRHIQLEERFLLPYCPQVKTPQQWPAHVYALEHRRLEELLNQAGTRLAVARRRGVKPAALIALLDQEKTLKHLLEHHHERENRALFRLVRDALPDRTLLELAQALHQQENPRAAG